MFRNPLFSQRPQRPQRLCGSFVKNPGWPAFGAGWGALFQPRWVLRA